MEVFRELHHIRKMPEGRPLRFECYRLVLVQSVQRIVIIVLRLHGIVLNVREHHTDVRFGGPHILSDTQTGLEFQSCTVRRTPGRADHECRFVLAV